MRLIVSGIMLIDVILDRGGEKHMCFFSGGVETCWSVFISAVNIYLIFLCKQNSIKDIIGMRCVNQKMH